MESLARSMTSHSAVRRRRRVESPGALELSGCDSGASLIGIKEPALKPAALVQVTTWHLDPPRFIQAADHDRVEPADGDEPLDRRCGALIVGCVEEHRSPGNPVRAGGE
jgi:hypothetical protein